ncbi:MAG: ABC transporter permease [Planctomycetaceae bacterium]|nr:ABC transporter permease [Planctomycetaceae bacterium]
MTANVTKSGVRIGSAYTSWTDLFQKYGIFIILVGMIVIMSMTNETFRTSSNVINVVNQVAVNGIIALFITLVIITGGIDLSVGSSIACGSVMLGYVLTLNPSAGTIPLACIAAIVFCGLAGVFNGIFIARFRMTPFVVTLASQMMLRGVAYIISGGRTFTFNTPAFRTIGQGKVFGVIPVPILVLLGTIVIAYILLHMTRFGRHIYAVGGNERAAEASGVNVTRVKLAVYTLMGVFAGVSSIVLTSRVYAGQPSIAEAYEFDAIAATIIGGTSVNGGIGSIPRTIVGIIIFGIINNGMNLYGVNTYYQRVVKGLIILGAVLLDTYMRREKK